MFYSNSTDGASRYNSYIQIYTDASKSLDSKTGVVFLYQNLMSGWGKGLMGKVSVYTWGMVALVLALHWVEDSRVGRALI